MRQSGFHPSLREDDQHRCAYYPHETGLQDVILYCPLRPLVPQRARLRVAATRWGRTLEATVTISDFPVIEEGALPPSVARRVFRFIRANRLVLQALWNDAIGYEDAAQRFRRS